MRDLNEDRLQNLIGRLYEAALKPSLWPATLHEISDALGADSAALFGLPLAANIGIFCSPGGDAAFDWLAREGTQVHNPRPERAMRMGAVRRALTESDLFTEWELKNLPFNVALSELGFHWEAGGVFTEIDGAPLFFTTQRRSGRDGFGKPELEAITALFVHLERAAQISSRLWSAHAGGMLEAYERTHCAAILLDGDGQIVRMNRSADRLLGRGLYVRSRQLCSPHEASDRTLQHLIASITTEQPTLTRKRVPSTTTLHRSGARPLVAHGIPLVGEAKDVFLRAKAILVIVDPDVRREVSSAILAASYKLTPAEVRLANALAAGKDLKAAAVEHGVKLTTARNQLKAIMVKTETSRQAELIALLTRLALVSDQAD